MDEGMLITHRQTGNPPFVHVRLITIGHMDISPAAGGGVPTIFKILQTVQILQIPPNGSLLAIDLEGIERFVTTGRSEEHTSELQSRGHLVCSLLLEKK